LKIGQEKLFYVLSILCFRETRNRKKGWASQRDVKNEMKMWRITKNLLRT
jgi:hypothetical protein